GRRIAHAARVDAKLLVDEGIVGRLGRPRCRGVGSARRHRSRRGGGRGRRRRRRSRRRTGGLAARIARWGRGLGSSACGCAWLLDPARDPIEVRVVTDLRIIGGVVDPGRPADATAWYGPGPGGSDLDEHLVGVLIDDNAARALSVLEALADERLA